jgi:hypothetical protein
MEMMVLSAGWMDYHAKSALLICAAIIPSHNPFEKNVYLN